MRPASVFVTPVYRIDATDDSYSVIRIVNIVHYIAAV